MLSCVRAVLYRNTYLLSNCYSKILVVCHFLTLFINIPWYQLGNLNNKNFWNRNGIFFHPLYYAWKVKHKQLSKYQCHRLEERRSRKRSGFLRVFFCGLRKKLCFFVGSLNLQQMPLERAGCSAWWDWVESIIT